MNASEAIPALVGDSRAATIKGMNLLLLAAFCFGCFYLGRQSPDPARVEADAQRNERIAAALEAQAAHNKAIAEALREQSQTLRDIKAKVDTVNTETQFVSSHYKRPR